MVSSKHLGQFWVVIAIIFVVYVIAQTLFFHNINLRNDEITTVHAATVLDFDGLVDWLANEGTHPVGWRILAVNWVEISEYDPGLIRFHSTLFTLLSLAVMYRLGADSFDRQTGLLTVILAGAVPFAFYHLHEFRPYAPLVAVSGAYMVVYLRWLARPNLTYSLLLTMVGVIGLQAHYYFGPVCASIVIFHFLAVQHRYWHARRFLLINAAIFLSFVWWIPTVVSRQSSDSVIYDLSPLLGLLALIVLFNFLPAFGLAAMLLPIEKRFPTAGQPNRYLDIKFGGAKSWRIMYPATILIGVTLMALAGNIFVESFSPRNFLAILPVCGVMVAYAIRVYTPFGSGQL